MDFTALRYFSETANSRSIKNRVGASARLAVRDQPANRKIGI